MEPVAHVSPRFRAPASGAWILLPALLLGVACAGAPEANVEPILVRRLGCMGTGLEITLWGEERSEALAASEAAVRALEAAEARLTT